VAGLGCLGLSGLKCLFNHHHPRDGSPRAACRALNLKRRGRLFQRVPGGAERVAENTYSMFLLRN